MFAHLVVVGEIDHFFKLDTTLDEWRTDPDGDHGQLPHEVQGIVVRNVECLRGRVAGSRATVFYWQTGITTLIGLDAHVSIGDRVLLAAEYVPESDRYLLAGASAAYVEGEDGFRRLSDRVVVSLDELRETVRQADPRRLYGEAELVVFGSVMFVGQDREADREHGFQCRRYDVRTTRVFKGAAAGESVSLRLPLSFCPYPEYRMPLPDGVAAGDSVLAFVAEGPFGPYIVGGRNGLLRVENGVLRRGYAEHEMSGSELWHVLAESAE